MRWIGQFFGFAGLLGWLNFGCAASDVHQPCLVAPKISEHVSCFTCGVEGIAWVRKIASSTRTIAKGPCSHLFLGFDADPFAASTTTPYSSLSKCEAGVLLTIFDVGRPANLRVFPTILSFQGSPITINFPGEWTMRPRSMRRSPPSPVRFGGPVESELQKLIGLRSLPEPALFLYIPLSWGWYLADELTQRPFAGGRPDDSSNLSGQVELEKALAALPSVVCQGAEVRHFLPCAPLVGIAAHYIPDPINEFMRVRKIYSPKANSPIDRFDSTPQLTPYDSDGID